MTSTQIRTTLARLDVVESIKEVLNSEICYCPILRNLQREYDANVINNNTTCFSDLGNEDRNEVFVYLGRILESVITCELAKYGLNVSKDRTSSGDVTVNKKIWEIKGTSGNNSWTGSTHASKKEDKPIDFIGVKYGIDEDADVFKVLSGDIQLVPNIFIGVFEQLKFIRRGKETKSNSRTSLLISKENYDIVKEQVSWGYLKKLRKNSKYLELVAE
tara:strand:+ start:121 stop:771 length:651 start_codon:yes stop_codon:yes gene_type:complete